ncbi:MAG: type II secretion system GspH family protein [Planctomycetaceae bacterium]|nr:type II secretion system GspH family protein [Planctomycetaceae bacterium]
MCRKMRSFTLIEVLIVLVLITAVMLLVCMAVDVHLRQMTISRTEVEEAQAARTILNVIANDIRNVIVQLRKEQLEVDVQSLSAAAGAGGSTAIVPSETETASGNSTEETMIYGQKPGIYGDLNWLQVDTAKLPRGEMYGSRQVRNAASLLSDRLSPSKTVFYYLVSESDTSKTEKGLYRRQLDRQVTQYEINEGKETEYEQYDEVFAPEVVNIEFAYFTTPDSATSTVGETAAGQTAASSANLSSATLLEYWDMDDMQTLPAAVQITLTVRRQSFGKPLLAFSETTQEQTIVYSLIVPIETGKQSDDSDEAEVSEE